MQPPDVMFLDVLIIAIGMTVIGIVVPAVWPLIWFGIALVVGIAVAWIINKSTRHGSHY